MREVKFLELGFENCETSERLSVGDMHEDDVHTFSITGIERRIGTLAVDYAGESLVAKDIRIVLNPKANRSYESLGGERSENETLFDRIRMFSDITSICIIYDDETEEEISVPWNFNHSEYSNSWQFVSLNAEGQLTININKG